MGVKAEWVEDYSIDYSTMTGFPFYVMGYVPEWVDGIMTDYGADYRYETQDNLDGDGDGKWKEGESSVGTVTNANGTEYQKVTGAGPYWHQYIIASDVPMELDGNYTIKAVVRASATVSANLQFGNWGSLKETGVSIPASTDFQEVEWEVTGCIYAGRGFICIQPGTSTATIEWKSLTVSHDQKVTRPTIWQEWLNSDGLAFIPEEGKVNDKYMGNAETPWADPNVKFTDQTQNYLICAWGKEKGENMNDDGGWDPFPARIEADPDDAANKVFVVHGKAATTEGDASAWDNQFWIQSPKEWKAGTQVKIKFRYKASKAVTVATQCHKQNPSDYLIWHAIGDVNFTEKWQDFENTVTIEDDMGGTWSVAFQLNQNDKEAIDFYFDDLSWQSMKLDEGYFVAGANPGEGLEYDLDNAIEFVEGTDVDGEECLVATVGTKDAYVSQIMISTIRGNDAAFKGATLKPAGAISNDPTDWLDYTASSLAKLNLPGSGIWKIYLSTEYKMMAFEMLEGTVIEKPEIKPNPTVVVVNGLEREPTATEQPADEEAGIAEGTGQPWDNQFFIVANRNLAKGEATVLSFKYKSSVPAKTTTQCHNEPGAYMFWGAIGDVNFTEEWQDFEQTFTIPADADGMKSIAFNMAEIKEACVYEIKDIIWKTEDGMETLINMEGADNFYVKEGAGTAPYIFGKKPSGDVVKGDFNGDNIVNALDIQLIINACVAESTDEKFDINSDGKVNALDIQEVINIAAAAARLGLVF